MAPGSTRVGPDTGGGPAASAFFAAMRDLYRRSGRPAPRALAAPHGRTHLGQIVIGRLLPGRWTEELSELVRRLGGDIEALRRLWIDAHRERELDEVARDAKDDRQDVAEVRQLRDLARTERLDPAGRPAGGPETGEADARWLEAVRLARRGDAAAAERVLRHVLTVYGDVLGYGATRTIQAWRLQADLRRRQGGTAVDVLGELLRRQSGHLGGTDPRTQETRRTLANLMIGSGRLEEAHRLLIEARSAGAAAEAGEVLLAKAELVAMLERDGRWEQVEDVLSGLLTEARHLHAEVPGFVATLERRAERARREVIARRGGRHARRRDEVVIHLRCTCTAGRCRIHRRRA